jgi:hypothetical protein
MDNNCQYLYIIIIYCYNILYRYNYRLLMFVILSLTLLATCTKFCPQKIPQIPVNFRGQMMELIIFSLAKISHSFLYMVYSYKYLARQCLTLSGEIIISMNDDGLEIVYHGNSIKNNDNKTTIFWLFFRGTFTQV